MRVWLLQLGVVGLMAGCAAPDVPEPMPPEPVPEAATPDIQEAPPVTQTVKLYGYQDGSDIWHVDIIRPQYDLAGELDVTGPGDAARAAFFAAKACMEDGGMFKTGIEPRVLDLPNKALHKYIFPGACV